MHPSQTESLLPTALLVPAVLQPAKGAHLPGIWPRTGAPNLWLSPLTPQGGSLPMYFPFSSKSPPRGITWLLFNPSYLITCGSFSQCCLYRSLPASFQLDFGENCSTCHCIFNVFMGGGEFHVLSPLSFLIPPKVYILTSFTHFSHPHLHLWPPPIYSLYLWLVFFFVCLFLDSTYKWEHTVFVFLILAYFT